MDNLDNEILFNSYIDDSITNEQLSKIFFECPSLFCQKKFFEFLLEKCRKPKKASGRPRVNFDFDLFKELYVQWKNKEITAKKFMKTMRMQPNTFYRRVKEFENGKKDNL